MVYENDTEHSYNLAMTAWFLAQWFPELDKNKVIQYALAHDLVEIHAGDTFIYGSPEELASKTKREAKAFKKLSKEWADFEDIIQCIKSYETRTDDEAKFVYALDKIMPIMLVYLHDGHSWEIDNITAKMLYEAKIEKVALSPEITPYFEELNDLLLEHPEIIRSH